VAKHNGNGYRREGAENTVSMVATGQVPLIKGGYTTRQAASSRRCHHMEYRMEQALPPLAVPETPDRILRFWRAAGYEYWFAKDDNFDRVFRDHFLGAHLAAARRELDHWMDTADGCLALLILLDQFPRNALRGCGHMYATDPLARFVARHTLDHGFDKAHDHDMRSFCYLPFEHSENMADQDLSVALFTALGEPFLPYAIEHRKIIEAFGRFPHRNEQLGRITTPEEQAFLDNGGFSG